MINLGIYDSLMILYLSLYQAFMKVYRIAWFPKIVRYRPSEAANLLP